ncbi:MAG TPA: hypothetical protein PLV06_03700 [Bacteroidales bacterium]|nr:hypothetical protein [Bacteroidales bacterium]HPF02139.1 hypothetical protein [Bacteroidales bacterium]HPJ58136.1 hypothetical protein [Bacteroidales bacterium]HPR11467.1 hypothetical protein [Bacteroidales bacterium]HRW84546.1 hypothetical protein [Bacteroidales bacterium]
MAYIWNKSILLLLSLTILLNNCSAPNSQNNESGGSLWIDIPFIQDYSIKYYCNDSGIQLLKVVADRNGYVQIFSSEGLMRPHAGQMLFPGTLVKDRQYRPIADKNIAGISLYDGQLVYVDDEAVLSNAWAGKLFSRHLLPGAKLLAGGTDFHFMISDGRNLVLINGSGQLWTGSLNNEEIRDIRFDKTNNTFWILGERSLNYFDAEKRTIEKILDNENLTCIEITGNRLIAGTSDGYLEIDTRTRMQSGDIQRELPWNELTAVCEIDGNLWFGSTWGAMMLREDGKFDYYGSERWIPSDTVVSISKGTENSVLILTTRGLAKICFMEMTLHEKAIFFEKQVRERHVRNGFNSTSSGMKKGDVTSGSVEDSDNDGLWTSMYLAAETFRYAVTQSADALANIREALEAMERLYTINPVPGFPARSFERRGYKYDDTPWRRAEDPEWDWKSTTSSDEAIGHIFAFGVIAELIKEPDIRNKAVELIDTLMSHILKNNFYLVDWDGQPTRWGRWNPEYVNGFSAMIGDRKLNSSNITGMLQTAYHFTGKEKYKEAAFYLLTEHGYLENLMRPMEEIGKVPEEADALSRLLSEGWNHSDDEMYFCGYWGLYRYAFNDTLKAKYRQAILDHWEAERPEKEALWNILTAITGAEDIDLEEAIWYLQEYPMDLINWTVKNSHRKDIEFLEPNFRNQSIREVLPPDELRISRHNANRFDLDGGDDGRSEYSAGDIWLLPYWAGRFLGVISEPSGNTPSGK